MSTRRDFLAAAGAASLVSAGQPLLRAMSPAENKADAASDYGFAPGLVYLNTGSTGPTPRAVLERTVEAWKQVEQNPVANCYGMEGVLGWAEKTREKAASFLGCTADELLMTRSTSEAMNTVAQSIRVKPGDRVLITDQEHTGGSDCWRYLAERRGVVIDKVPILAGEHDPTAIVQRFADAIKPDTRVISFSHILYTTGLRMPVAEIAALARSQKILCVVDGAQAAGNTPIDVKVLGCHAYATTSHKWLMGPKGIGMLYIRADATDDIKPIQWTGGKRVVGDSVGVGPLPIMVGLGTAIDIANARGVAAIEAHNMALRDRLYPAVARIPGVKMMSLSEGRFSSAFVCFALPARFDNHDLQQKLLGRHNIMTKMIPKEHFNGLRISPHVFNTDAQMDALVAALEAELR